MIELIVFLYFCLVSLGLTWPLILNLSTKTIGLHDELFITWTINWAIKALSKNPLAFFQSNIFYPYKNTLAYSDTHLANSLLALPFIKIFKEPLLAFNINLLAGFILTGFFTYLLIKYLTKSKLIGIIGGTILTFSTIHLNYLGHLQLFCFQYLILSILVALKFLEKRNKTWFILLVIISLLTTLNNFLIGFFLVFSIAIIFLFKRVFKWLIIWGLTLFILSTPFFLPYFQVSKEFNYQRPIRDAIHFSLQPEDLVYPSNMTRLESVLMTTFNLKLTNSAQKATPGYLGLTFYALAATSIIYFLINKKKRNKDLLIYSLISLTGLILAFGPVMHWARKTIHYPLIIPLPYIVLYYILPGFSGFRTPSRFILLFAFGLVLIISLFLNQLFKKIKPIYQITLASLIILFTILEFNFPLKLFDLPKKADYPKVYYYLDSLDKTSPIIELPILNWDSYDSISIETRRELYSTINFRPMVNGYSGFTPPEREGLMKEIMLDFPNAKLVQWLKTIKVKYIIIHKKDYDELSKTKFLVNGKKFKPFKTIKDQLKNFEEISFLKETDEDYLYEIK